MVIASLIIFSLSFRLDNFIIFIAFIPLSRRCTPFNTTPNPPSPIFSKFLKSSSNLLLTFLIIFLLLLSFSFKLISSFIFLFDSILFLLLFELIDILFSSLDSSKLSSMLSSHIPFIGVSFFEIESDSFFCGKNKLLFFWLKIFLYSMNLFSGIFNVIFFFVFSSNLRNISLVIGL